MMDISQIIKDSSESFLGSGIILTTLISLGASLRNVPKQLSNLFINRVVYTVDIENNSEVYNYITLWLNNRSLLLTPKSIKCTYNLSGKDSVDYTGSPGSYLFFMYKGKLCWYFLSREALAVTNTENKSSKGSIIPSYYRETINLHILGGSIEDVKAIVEEATELYKNAGEEEGIKVYATNYYGDWSLPTLLKNPRTFDNLSYDSATLDPLLEDLDKFVASEDLYKKKGIKYRRGYLLYGPPGTGKSSIVEAIAHKYKYAIRNVKLREMTDSDLYNAMSSVNESTIVLIEDIDSVYEGKELREGKSVDQYPSYEAMLNSISGLTSSEDIILIVTTNDVTKLDEALLRPGRLDVSVHLGYVTEPQVRDMYVKFTEDTTENNINEFIQSFGSLTNVSPAMVTDKLVRSYFR